MNGLYCVYKHTFPDEKVYIGITKRKPEYRWGKDGTGYKGCPRMSEAIAKCGWDNVKHEILLDNIDEKTAQKMEIELIKEYNSTDIRFGYNVSLGGDVVSENAINAANAVNMRPIVQLDQDGRFIKEWPCAASLSELYGATTCITCCDKRRVKNRKLAYGYIWMYKEDYDVWDGDVSYYKIKYSSSPRRTLKCDTNGVCIKEYVSASEAARDNNADPSGVAKAAKNGVLYKGFLWKYVDLT